MKQELDGRVDQAFGHLMLIGLASILEQQGVARVRIHWSNGMDPRPVIEADCEWLEACELVRAYAETLTSDGSWVVARTVVDGKSRALFSPRSGEPAASEWMAIESQRHAAVEELGAWPADWMSLRMIGALGAAAYWGREVNRRIQVDQGASRWEMKTRNRGEEFVGNRLAPLTSAVALRDAHEISDGLLGCLALDEKGKRASVSSRLATGLRSPAPVDAAQAWCALLGLSSFPVLHQVDQLTRTAGYEGRYSTGFFHVPVPGRATSPAVVRAVIASEMPRGFLTGESEASRQAAGEGMAKRGFVAVVKFPLLVSGNSSAPERWAGVGEVIPTARDWSEPVASAAK